MTPEERFFQQLLKKAVCGLGSVIVPPDVDRQTYIDNCFSTETVSVMPEFGGMSFNRVPIALSALQNIEFPEEGNSFGSQVVFLYHPNTRAPFIIAVLDKKNELVGVEWKQFKLFKALGDNFVSVVGDGKRGNLYVTVRGTEDNAGGQILVSVINPQNKGKIQVQVQGDIVIVGNNISMTCLTTKIVSKDSFEVQTDTAVVKAETKISLGKENYEPAVLGNKLKDDIIKPLLSALKTDLMVATAVGPSGPPLPQFTAKIVEIEAKLDTILSQKVETE